MICAYAYFFLYFLFIFKTPTTGSFTSTISPFSNESDVQPVRRARMEGYKPTHACRVLVCRGALELYYSRI